MSNTNLELVPPILGQQQHQPFVHVNKPKYKAWLAYERSGIIKSLQTLKLLYSIRCQKVFLFLPSVLNSKLIAMLGMLLQNCHGDDYQLGNKF